MWGSSRINASITNYAAAKRIYDNTKPVRGTYVRPVGCPRSSNAKSRIEKHGEDYVFILWNTPVVTYKPNGEVFLDHAGYRTPATAGAISALSPLRCWSSKGELCAATGDYYADRQRFIIPSKGLLFRPDAEGKLQPVDPPVAVQRKKRVKREEARAARRLFKQVPVFIKAFSAAFEGGEKPAVGYPRLGHIDLSQPLDEEDAANIAWWFVLTEGNYTTGTRSIVNAPVQATAAFWKLVYMQLGLIEEYEVELPFGEVA